MSLARFAGQALGALKRYAIPTLESGAIDWGGVALRYGPDAAFSGIYAATAPLPDGMGIGDRLGLAAENMLWQTVPGVLGATGAGTAARRMGASRQIAQSAAGMGDMGGMILGPMGSMMADQALYDAGSSLTLYPFQRKIQEKAEKDAQLRRELELQGAFEQGINSAGAAIGNSNQIEGIDRLLMALYG